MKSVVMIAYHFPPEGNAGAHRPLRFVRQLPSKGWQPTVITLATDFYERYDSKLLNSVPPEITVIRVRNRDPWKAFQQWRGKHFQQRVAKLPAETVSHLRAAHQAPIRSSLRELVRAAETWCYHPDPDMGWIRPAVNAALKHCAVERPDVIWATAGPVSSFHVAERSSRRTGVPYVLDFRDAWTITFNEFEDRRPAWARQRDRRNMFRLLKGAQAVIFRYHTEAECYWRAYHGALEPSKIRIIPNGFEGEVEAFTASKGRTCELLYTGTLSDYRYDTLLEAIGSLKGSFPEEAARLHFHFVGEGTRAIGDRARELDLTEIITTEAAIPHRTVIQLSKQADALLLLGRPPAMKGYELFAPAKLFGYLKAGRPIVAILPADEAKRILEHVGVSTVADVDSVANIVAVLRRVLHSWAEGTLESLLPDLTACRAYSAERQTQTLVSALDGAPSLESFVPGKFAIPDSLQKEISHRENVYKREASGISLQTYSSSSRP